MGYAAHGIHWISILYVGYPVLSSFLPLVLSPQLFVDPRYRSLLRESPAVHCYPILEQYVDAVTFKLYSSAGDVQQVKIKDENFLLYSSFGLPKEYFAIDLCLTQASFR